MSVTVQNDSTSLPVTYAAIFSADINKGTYIQFRILLDSTEVKRTSSIDMAPGINAAGIPKAEFGSPISFNFPVTISDKNQHVIKVQWRAQNTAPATSYQYGSKYPRSLMVVAGGSSSSSTGGSASINYGSCTIVSHTENGACAATSWGTCPNNYVMVGATTGLRYPGQCVPAQIKCCSLN